MSTHCLVLAASNLRRAAWQALLERQPGITVAGTVPDTAHIANFPKPPGPTAVLVDMASTALELVAELQTAAPGSGLLFLVDAYELQTIVPMLRAGATGFLSRDASVGDLARSIIAAGRGELVLPPEQATRALLALARDDLVQEPAAATLTDREQEVLGLLAQGLTNKEIAQSLILSVRTVEAHLRNVYGKLGVTSRTEAAVWAVHHGFGSGR